MDRPGIVGREPEHELEPIEAPEPATLPDPEPVHGERGYEPVHPRWGVGDFFRKLAAPVIALGYLILKFGGLLLKLKVFTTGISMLVSIAAYAWLCGLPFALGF